MRGRLREVLRGQSGLTLLEVLIAMAILGVILAILGAALRISFGAVRTGDRHMERVQRARVITEQIAQELRGAYRFSPTGSGEEPVVFRGEPDRFSLVTTAALRARSLTPSGLKEVTFSVEEDSATGSRGLVLREDIIPHGELFEEGKGYRTMLDPTVAALRCRYFGSPSGEGETERPPSWEERWDNEHLPKAVEVVLAFQKSKERAAVELPPITVMLPIEREMMMEK